MGECKTEKETGKEKTTFRDAIIAKFNEEYGNEISIFENSAERTEGLWSLKREVENALSLDCTGDAPSKIAVVIQRVQNAVVKIDEFSQRQEALRQYYAKHQKEVEDVKMKTYDYVFQINQLEKACEYLKIIGRIGDISAMIEAGFNEKNVKKQETHFMLLKSIYRSMQGIKCKHLLAYTNETLHYWHNIFKDKLGNEFVELLKVIKWPFSGDSSDSVPTPENINKFQMLTEQMLNFELDPDTKNSSASDDKPLCLPITLLINPLKKRFMYHFTGSRKTNRLDKPEWYFTQILLWIKNHQDFIETNLQPVYDKVKRTHETAKMEFMRGLVDITIKKLHYELAELQYEDSLFSHCVDEALGFEKELRTLYGYPEDKFSIPNVLTQAPILVKWINMERRYAAEKMDEMLMSPTAFETLSSKGKDTYRITECADAFLSLVGTITHRSEMLPQPGHRLQLLELQCEVIDEFRIRLLQRLRDQTSNPLNSTFPKILNSVNYLRSVLEDMGTNTFFLHLQFFKAKLEGIKEYEGSVFDENVSSLAAVRDEYLSVLVDHVFMDIKAKSMPYRKNRWHALESPKDLIRPSVSPTACPMFQVLIDRLHEMQEALANDLFHQAWCSLATKLDHYLFEEIVAICVFNEGGALQFSYDITKNLFPLFGHYSFKPESHFKLLKDSCTLLTMPVGLAISLRDTLENLEETCDIFDSGDVMVEVGIFTLKKADVVSIISRRTDIS